MLEDFGRADNKTLWLASAFNTEFDIEYGLLTNHTGLIIPISTFEQYSHGLELTVTLFDILSVYADTIGFGSKHLRRYFNRLEVLLTRINEFNNRIACSRDSYSSLPFADCQVSTIKIDHFDFTDDAPNNARRMIMYVYSRILDNVEDVEVRAFLMDRWVNEWHFSKKAETIGDI